MQGFSKWFSLQEAVSLRQLFHGTATGANNATLTSFKANGVLPPSAESGHGQGGGFYLFSDFDSAARHAMSLKTKSDAGTLTTLADTEGLPMVVQLNASMHPDDYDIDYEGNGRKIIAFIHDHANMFQNLLSGEQGGLERTFSRPNADGVNMKGIKLGGIGSLYDKGGDVMPDEAAALSRIWRELKNHNPEFDQAFKMAFFSDMKPGIAIKYVGDRKLNPYKIFVYSNGQWQNA